MASPLRTRPDGKENKSVSKKSFGKSEKLNAM